MSAKLNAKSLEKLVKGFSNHRRIQMMELLDEKPGLSVLEIADELHVNFKTVSEHLRRLTIPGLILKKNVASSVCHNLSVTGKVILKFLRTLE